MLPSTSLTVSASANLDFGAQSHTPHNCCVRFEPAVADGHATLATRRALPLTRAGLPPAGTRQLLLAHKRPRGDAHATLGCFVAALLAMTATRRQKSCAVRSSVISW